MEEASRYDKVRAFMAEHRYTWHHVGALLGIGNCGASMALSRPRIKEEYRIKLLAFGFPEDILPASKSDAKIKEKIKQIQDNAI